MPDFTLKYIVEFCAIAGIMAVCVAIGFAVFKSIELVRAERLIAEWNNPKVSTLLSQLAYDQGGQNSTLNELEIELRFVQSRFQRRELIDALNQPNESGRRAYAAKLVESMRAATPPRQMAGGGGGQSFF